MQDPLKQGLKLGLPYFLYSQAFYSNARSIKTRIETTLLGVFSFSPFFIRMQDPLKQGLKRIFLYWLGVSWVIRMQDPLKHGLKPSVLLMGVFCRVHSNARSIKQRTETDLHFFVLWQTTKIIM